ncbi:hypothetical protein [Pseudomonas fluorescens]|uniref:hypothetical protein n=1 Tax=Pseudomonas fluorescens TaxID=294 RepID=UPI003804898A
MLRYNAAMADALLALDLSAPLSVELSSIVEQGFFQKDGCEFLSFFKESTIHVGLSHFEDRTGYECFINSIHIDDYVDNNWLVSALQFANRLLEGWSIASHSEKLQVIVSSDEFGASVKAHVVRAGEFLLEEDLDGYDEALLLATSDGRALRELLSQAEEVLPKNPDK